MFYMSIFCMLFCIKYCDIFLFFSDIKNSVVYFIVYEINLYLNYNIK